MEEELLSVFEMLVGYATLFLTLVAASLVLCAALRALWQLLCRARRVRPALSEGLALALEFALGAELLRTLTVREWGELLFLAALLALRAAMTFLLRWEMRLEKKSGERDEGAGDF